MCSKIFSRFSKLLIIKILNLLFISFIFISTSKIAFAEAPVIYSSPNYQSPVRGEPGDLLLLPGYGFSAQDTVVYQAIDDTEEPLVTPTAVPNPIDNNANVGVVTVVSTADTPYSLTLKLPDVIISGQSYALWAINSKGQWSNGIKINDARPLWFSPSYLYETKSRGNLDRYLKVVGRNLQPTVGASKTKIRFRGPEPSTDIAYTRNAQTNSNPLNLIKTSIDHYVAKINLTSSKSHLSVGKYIVEISRDNRSWVALNQKLEIKSDPDVLAEFFVENYGGCAADEFDDPIVNPDPDDTTCIIAAINAAKVNGGVVVFGPGTWRLSNSTANALAVNYGIIVPKGVSLEGRYSNELLSIILRGDDWSAIPSFTLQGDNKVSGLIFKDEKVYFPSDTNSAVLRLGKIFNDNVIHGDTPEKIIQNVVITENVFDKPLHAIIDGGLPTKELFITNNIFGSYKTAIRPYGYRNNNIYKFYTDDAVITNNIFKPGSYISEKIQQGVIATELGAGRRVDFSGNVADGASFDYLYEPTVIGGETFYDIKIPGWRAGHFWAMNNNIEMMLVSENKVICPGDKTGDGEAFAYDNNANTFAFGQAQTVLAASFNSIKVPGPLKYVQNSQDLTQTNPATGNEYRDEYYLDHWVSIPEGKGLGQVRRITSYTRNTDNVTFTIEPAWDVIPDTGSRMTVSRQYWQVNTVDNYIDQRDLVRGGQCTKGNHIVKSLGPNKDVPTRVYNPEGGAITLWAQTADSSVENNQMYDTDGISLQQTYNANSSLGATFFQSFVEVRGNTIDHEYDWSSDCSWSGIWGSYSASNTAESPPPVAGYGVSFSHNTIIQADALRGGAIGLTNGWLSGPSPNKWKVVNNTLVHHNILLDITRSSAPTYQDYSILDNDSTLDDDLIYKCDSIADLYPAAGIKITRNSKPDPLVWRTTLYKNTCDATVDTNLVDNGTSTVRVCSSGLSNSCECDGVPGIDIELHVEAFTEADGRFRYETTLTNNSEIDATGVTFSVEPDANSIIDSSADSNAYDSTAICESCLPDVVTEALTCTPEVRTCNIQSLASGATLKFNVYGTATPNGVATTNFSVTHSGYDTDASNNGFTVSRTPPPFIASFNPTSVAIGGGASISGFNFCTNDCGSLSTSNTILKIKDKTVNSIISILNPSLILFFVPEDAETGPITVITPWGTATTSENIIITTP